MVDVLDRDRAGLHACAARDAVPHHVVGHRARDERRRLAAPGRHRRPLGEELVAQAHDEELGRERLAGRPRRAGVLATAALGAREGVDHLLPRHVGDRAGAEPHVLFGPLLVEPQRLEPAPCTRAPEEDVHHRGRDVEVLGVRQVGQEPDDEEHVRPDEDALGVLGPRPAAEQVRERVRDRRPPAGHSFRPSAIRVACHRRSVVTIPAMSVRIRSASPTWLPSNRAGRCTLRMTNAVTTPAKHQHREDVDEQREPPLASEPRDRLVACRRPRSRHHDRREEDEEPPEDERVHQARDEPLEQLALAQRDHDLVPHPAGSSPERSLGRPILTSRTRTSARRVNSPPPTASTPSRTRRATGSIRPSPSGSRRRSPGRPRAGRRSRRSRRSRSSAHRGRC